MGVYLTCIDCGEKFEFTDSEIYFYKSKGFAIPKRCKACRTIKNKKQDDQILKKLGHKRSSFLDNAKIYGIGTPVEGGLYTEHRYIFKLQLETENFYIRFDDENKKLYRTKNMQNATSFIWTNDLIGHKDFLEKKFPDSKVILFPISNYCTIRTN